MNPVSDDRSLFERLMLLRALYARRGDRDRYSAVSIAEVIRHAELLLAARPAALPSA